MRRLLYILTVLVIGTLPLTISATLPQKMFALGPAAERRQQQQGQRRRRNRQREEEFYRQRASQNGRPVPQDIYDQATEQWRRIPRARVTRGRPGGKARSLSALSAVTSLTGTVWKSIGPSPITQGSSQVNGRVSAIAINPNNANVIYQGSSGGGLWRTIDGGNTWTPLYDQQTSLGTGEPSSVAIDPNNTNILYVGTSGRFVLNISKGILKSTDGGGSWIVLGSNFPANNTGNADNLFAGQNINTIIVDPANSSALYLAASNGLFRSTDTGQNWTLGAPAASVGSDSQSLVLDSSSPTANRILFAGINGSGVFRSNNSAQNWTQVLSSATTAVASNLPVPPAGGSGPFIGKIVVTLAPPTSPPNSSGVQVIYAAVEAQTFDSMGNTAADVTLILRSIDQGANWNFQSSQGGSQGGYDLEMGVDPASPGNGTTDIIYLGLVGQFRSSDSGATFANVSNGQHVDSHSLWAFFRPTSGSTFVFNGNDGGIWRSVDDGAHWTGTGLPGAPPTINAGGLQTALFYNLDVRNDATAGATLGSLQDNGTPQTTGSLTWNDSQGGDGWDNGFDAVITNNAYNSSGFWPTPCTRVFRDTNSGATFPPTVPSGQDVTPWGMATDQGCYLAPVNSDPSQANVIYVSGNQNIWQTQNGGTNWRIIANIGGPAQLNVARANSNNVVAASGAQVFVSTNALAATVGPPTGVTFTNITRNLPNRTVARVAFDPNDPTVIYAVMGGFGTPIQPQNVFRTTIGGTTWTDISPPVNVPVNALALDGTPAPTTIYIGNDLGVMRSVDGGASWTVLDDVHLPNVPVTDLAINTQAGVLRAATFGRGAFELAAATGPVISINAENGLQFDNVCSGATSSLIIQVFNTGTQDLLINSVQRLFGSNGFTVLPNPSTPLIISPNSEVDFTVRFTPTVSSGSESAQIRISSNDPAAPSFDLMATANIGTPAIDTLIADAGNFGDVCVGSSKDLALTINNSGTCDLSISNITSSSGQFQIASVMTFPVVVGPGGNVQVPIRFQPSLPFGAKTATIIISSNDPGNPTKTVNVSGNVPPGDIKVTGSTDFGDVCAGTLAEKAVSICNVGLCDLHVTGASLSCPDFTLVNNPFPATVSPDSCLSLVIRFTPTSAGPKSCTLTITSDDPDMPVITKTVTANTPSAAIDVSPDQSFLPEVIQSIGSCNTLRSFPISNKGTCNLTINSITIGGTNAADFGLSGLPSFPIILEPGHTVGDGALMTIFAPTAIDRDRLGTLMVTYVSDPITGATTTVARNLCGEGVNTGTRVLVTAGGVPVTNVERIHLQRINANRNKNKLDTVDNAMNLPLVTVTPTAPCGLFQYHREYGTVSNPIQLLPGSYTVTATAIVNGKRRTKTVGFDVTTCDFNPTIVIDLP